VIHIQHADVFAPFSSVPNILYRHVKIRQSVFRSKSVRIWIFLQAVSITLGENVEYHR